MDEAYTKPYNVVMFRTRIGFYDFGGRDSCGSGNCPGEV